MTAFDVNQTGYIIGFEATVGDLAPTPTGYVLEPNEVSKWGAEITGARRQPISRDRMPRASTVVDLDSGVEMAVDCTGEHLRTLMETLMFALPKGRVRGVMYPTAVNTDEYTVSDVNVTIPTGALIWASGFAMSANNGLKLVAGVPSDTEVPADNLVAETTTADQNATIEICGVQGASGDIVINEAGDLTSTTLNMTTLGWEVGQILHLGDPTSGAAFRFDEITDDMYDNGDGFVRIRSIAAGVVTLDKNEALVALAGGAPGAGKTIRILFGEFYREYADDHANYSKKYASIEMAMPDLDAGTDAYSYARGNLLNTATFNFPLTDLVTMDLAWVGTDTPVPTTTRESWASKYEPRLTAPFNTTSSWRRRRITIHGEDTLVVNEMKELTLTISNGIAPEKVQGRLGAFKMNVGDRTCEGDSTWLLDDIDIWGAIRNHTKCSGDFAMGGEDGGFYFDLTSCRLSNGNPGLERNTSVTTEISIMPEKDTEMGYMIGFNRFPYLP